MATNAQKLEALNTFRAVAGLAPLNVWRVARNQPELDAYEAAARDEAEGAAHPMRRKGGGPKTKFSSIAKPCAVVWAFYGEHRDMPRKEAIAKLIAMGVDKGTANIQYGKAAKAQW